MAGKMSNRDRIAMAAAEAEARSKDKASAKGKKADKTDKTDKTEKAASKPAKKRTKAAPKRVRIVWLVCDPTGQQLVVYPYAQEEAARQDAASRTTASGKSHFVRRGEQPFDD